MKLDKMGFYFITDSALTKSSIIEDVKAALKAGVKIIQYREKNRPAKEMFEECRAIKELCRDKAIFLVNDRVDIAVAVDADGVHLGQEDLPVREARIIMGSEKILGVTAHSADEAADAENLGADYIGASPIFTTKTKIDAGRQAGLRLIREIKQRIGIPVVAIGGINLDNVRSVMEAGADSACAISAVIPVKDTLDECRKFVDAINIYYNLRS